MTTRCPATSGVFSGNLLACVNSHVEAESEFAVMTTKSKIAGNGKARVEGSRRRVTPKQNAARWRAAILAERKLWLAEHPGRTSVEYTKLLHNDSPNELIEWRIAKALKAEKAMRRAWLREHPGEHPLPEHLCALDHPFPRFKRWAAKARRWMGDYEARR
jgi:hypothetical protein